MPTDLVIRGAREHNLKNITVSIPRGTFTVFTGVSGSGKSTLAFDTIYAEGQRRYVESLSAYARQFLGLMSKPDVDSIEGLSPAISIEQKTTSKNPRSTVGTVTEIYDYLRLLFARIGVPHCPVCKTRIAPQTAEQIARQILARHRKFQVLAPVVRSKKGTYEHIFAQAKKDGFSRVRIDKAFYDLADLAALPRLERYKKHDIDIVVDRLTGDDKARVAEAVELALKTADGYALVTEDGKDTLYSSHAACPTHHISFGELQPRAFSFNSPYGACEDCHGLGFKQEFDPALLIPDPSLSIAEGAIRVWANHVDGWRVQWLGSYARHAGFSLRTPVKDLTRKHLQSLLHGDAATISYKLTSRDKTSSYEYEGDFEGLVPLLERLYKTTESDWRKEELERFMRRLTCPACKGRRLKENVLSVLVHGKNIIDITDLGILDAQGFFRALALTDKERAIARQILKEIHARLGFLANVGLGYLTLSRSAGTLSGGEAQRIRLATQIGSNLMGVLYILDEPSIGLHQRDNARLIDTLHRLRDLGNTLIVVEHDEDTIRRADYVVDIGPGAGIHGGRIVACGTPAQIMRSRASLTGQYLSRKKTIPVPPARRPPKGWLILEGCAEHNLKALTARFPLGTLTLVTGVSGSGKSTLINETLFPALKSRFHEGTDAAGKHRALKLPAGVDKVIAIDQSPIGRTPRSNPATYTKVFDDIRKLFAMTRDARLRGFDPGRFSFNVKGGRCEACAGDGLLKIEMNFLPDVYVECEECKGSRFNAATLEVKYKDKTIADILNMTVEEAFKLFENLPPIRRKLETLNDVGLGYIKLGQSSTTLSGGEAQRIKLTRELAKKGGSHTVYLLDEPTTGLHFDDVKRLLAVLDRLVDKGNTVVVIEHNLDVIKCADWIIDLGPEGGDAGGQIVAEGTPEEVAKDQKSHTGMFLRKVLRPPEQLLISSPAFRSRT